MENTDRNKQPLVSVLMPVYNAEQFVGEAIQSILNQTYQNFELIIVDDFSTDNSWKVIKSFAKQHPDKIKPIRLKKNLNQGGDPAGNVAFRGAKGEYLARMDADDVSLPTRLEEQVKFLKTHPEYVMVGANAYVVNRQGEIIGEKLVPTIHNEIYKEFFVLHPMIHPTVMMRRSALNGRKDIYKIVYQANNDYLTFFEMIANGDKFANLNEKLLYYRMHVKNDSLTQIKRKFVNSLKIRYRAVFEFGYKPTPTAVAKLAAQTILVVLLPEKLILHTYLLVKGISKPSEYLGFLKAPIFARVKRAFTSAS